MLALAGCLREAHEIVDELRDIATASLIENWIDEAERRSWFCLSPGIKGPLQSTPLTDVSQRRKAIDTGS